MSEFVVSRRQLQLVTDASNSMPISTFGEEEYIGTVATLDEAQAHTTAAWQQTSERSWVAYDRPFNYRIVWVESTADT